MYSIQVGIVCTNHRHSWPVVEVPSACTWKTWRGTIVGRGFAKRFHHGHGKFVENTHENPQKIQSYMEYPMSLKCSGKHHLIYIHIFRMLYCQSRYFQRGLRAFDGPPHCHRWILAARCLQFVSWLPCLDVIHMVRSLYFYRCPCAGRCYSPCFLYSHAKKKRKVNPHLNSEDYIPSGYLT